MDNPEHVDDELTQGIAEESGQKDTDACVEIASDALEQVAGGGGGTAIGLS
jgi:hypothetical protein